MLREIWGWWCCFSPGCVFLQRQSQWCGGDWEMAAQLSQSGCGTRSGEGGCASEECHGERNNTLKTSYYFCQVFKSILICNAKSMDIFFFLKMHFFLNHFYSSIVDLKAVHTKNNNCSDNYNDTASHTFIFYFRIQPCILKLVERKWCWRSLNVMFIGSFMWSLHFCHTAICIRKREKCPHLCKLRQSFWKVHF